MGGRGNSTGVEIWSHEPNTLRRGILHYVKTTEQLHCCALHIKFWQMSCTLDYDHMLKK
jgi:hypothetical protein